MGNIMLQGVTGGYKRLQGVTQGVTKGNMRLQGVTGGYKRLQGVRIHNYENRYLKLLESNS